MIAPSGPCSPGNRVALRCTGPEGRAAAIDQLCAPGPSSRILLKTERQENSAGYDSVAARSSPRLVQAAAAMMRSARVMAARVLVRCAGADVQWLARLSRAEATASCERSARSDWNQLRVTRVSARYPSPARIPRLASNTAATGLVRRMRPGYQK